MQLNFDEKILSVPIGQPSSILQLLYRTINVFAKVLTFRMFPEMPYGKVPVLYVDEKPLSQSVAICRYLGRVHHLVADDPWEAAKGDEVADTVHDLLPHAAQIVYAK